jgi:stage II sporulation protein M
VLRSRLEQDLAQHVRENVGVYFFVALLFLVGVVFGALAVKALPTEQKAELMDYLNLFLKDVAGRPSIPGSELVGQTVWANLKSIALIWLSGLTVIGLPLALILLFTKGFAGGFTVGFLVDEISWRGLVVAAAAVLPQSLLTVPAVLLVGAGAVCFALFVLRQRFLNRRAPAPVPFLSYAFFLVAAALAVAVAGVIEAYITPVFLRATTNWFL